MKGEISSIIQNNEKCKIKVGNNVNSTMRGSSALKLKSLSGFDFTVNSQ